MTDDLATELAAHCAQESFTDMVERLKGTIIYGVYDEGGKLLAWTWDFETAGRLSKCRIACTGLSPAFLASGGIGRMREVITNLLDALGQSSWLSSSHCDLCGQDAPRDPRDGSLLGPVRHKYGCWAGRAIALLSEVDGGAGADAEKADG